MSTSAIYGGGASICRQQLFMQILQSVLQTRIKKCAEAASYRRFLYRPFRLDAAFHRRKLRGIGGAV